MKSIIAVVIIGALALAGGWWYLQNTDLSVQNQNAGVFDTHEEGDIQVSEEPQSPSASIGEENLVEFRCDDSKGITAVFARDIVGLTLSDGRQMELRQAVSGSGIRYVNANETIEFHGKGEGAMLIEGGTTTFANCVAMI